MPIFQSLFILNLLSILSILCVISKIFERVVYEQVANHLEGRKLFYNVQSGFRSGYSTDTCLTLLSDFIKLQNDKGFLVGMVLLDLRRRLIQMTTQLS